MPFDTGLSQLLNIVSTPWERLGIVPVQPEFVKAYKQQYRAMHGRIGGGDRWRSVKFNPQRESLEYFLSTFQIIWRAPAPVYMQHVSTPAPKALIELALHVQGEVPDAQFSAEKFHYDPVLYATIECQKGCLGIWDDGKLKAIATRVI